MEQLVTLEECWLSVKFQKIILNCPCRYHCRTLSHKLQAWEAEFKNEQVVKLTKEVCKKKNIFQAKFINTEFYSFGK